MNRNTTKLHRIALLAGLMATTSHGSTLLTQLVAPGRSNYTGTIGTTFTVGAFDLSVTALGFQDANGDGLSSTHQVGIWNSAGTLLTPGVSVLSGTVGTLDTNYRYTTLGSAITLSAGQVYTIGAQVFDGGDAWTDASASAGFSASADVTTVDSNNYWATTFARPITDGGINIMRWGAANMQYSAVPEPSTYGLIGAGALAAFAMMRRRRKLAGKAA